MDERIFFILLEKKETKKKRKKKKNESTIYIYPHTKLPVGLKPDVYLMSFLVKQLVVNK